MASLKRWLDQRRNPWKKEFFDGFKAFRKDGGQQRLMQYQDVPAGAVVFDIGGFRGEWADAVLAQQPDCTVHIFEPHPEFAAALVQKFSGDARVHIHDYALGSQNGELQLSDAGDASSAVADHAPKFTAKIIDVKEFFEKFDIPKIDLAKMNIEGGEYDLLPAFIDGGFMPRINRLQVQFHLFEPALRESRATIVNNLKRTHSQTWWYPFVWEEWRKP